MHGVQTTKGIEQEFKFRARPWTLEDYEGLRQAVLAMVNTHMAWNRPHEIRASFDGRLYWLVLGKLDRAGREEKE